MKKKISHKVENYINISEFQNFNQENHQSTICSVQSEVKTHYR